IAIVSYFGLTKYSEGTNLFRTTSSNARVATSQDALIIFQKNPILGVGFNAYRYARLTHPLTCLPAGRSSSKGGETLTVDHGGAGTDNSFLFVLATTGIVGFVAYLYLLWSMVKVGKTNLGENPYSAVLIASLIALCVDSFFINSLFYPFILVWVWIVIALTEA
ncbi:MAG TPA: O-antigen ligase family protein, partial [Candidatus Saccharimonadales bacterium]|nr:O-antigen ligase family protein [Candidatus Saccharimonadales bacterium]